MNADEKRAWNVWQAWCLSAAILLGGCAIRPTPPSRPPVPATDAAHGDRAILDWVGTYAGIVPCADCPGVREVITLNKHLSYEIATQYVGRDDQVFRRGGRILLGQWPHDPAGGDVWRTSPLPCRKRCAYPTRRRGQTHHGASGCALYPEKDKADRDR